MKKTVFTGPDGVRAKPPRKKVVAAGGQAPPPPPVSHVLPDHGHSTGHAYHMFDETSSSQNMHSTYTEMLEENAVDLSAPLDDFDTPHVVVEAEVDQADEGGDKVEVIEEAEYDARVGRTDNYTETEDVCLMQAWESVSLDAVIGKDQTFGDHWQRIEDKYHWILSFPPPAGI
ncbi:uncharacterized protein [Triticum aestivum]|uniref:uncharacterized protein n=1 Tax=Triticum aestivum TaxID=4565 RepID=UPI001D0267D8|nr:uncharacterized protein LOC123047373 [Triticum aestivum]